MVQMHARAGHYSLLIVKSGEARHQNGAENIIWEHARRMHALRVAGLLSIACPLGLTETLPTVTHHLSNLQKQGRSRLKPDRRGTSPRTGDGSHPSPVSDGSELEGIGIFHASVEEVKTLMDEDPGVKAGIFVYEIHPCRGFPGDSLPKVRAN